MAGSRGQSLPLCLRGPSPAVLLGARRAKRHNRREADGPRTPQIEYSSRNFVDDCGCGPHTIKYFSPNHLMA